MTPEQVLEPLLRRVSLPASLGELVYELLQNEIETGYPVLSYLPEDDSPPKNKYIHGLQRIFDRLPPNVQELHQGALSARLRDLINLTIEDIIFLVDLRIPSFYVYNRQRALKSEIREAEHSIYQRRQDKEDATHLVSRLRDLKDDYRTIENPVQSAALESRGKTLEEMYSLISGTIWDHILSYNLSFDIPQKLRAQHCHVMASTGAGKTQLLSQLIYEDIQTDAAVIVMTLKGSLIPTFSALEGIDPSRLLHLSFENPIPINIFDIQVEHTDSAIELINHVFSDLLDAETTSKQTTMLNYCIRLLLRVPGATLATLRSLFKQRTLPTTYQDAVNQLGPSAQEFFIERFADKGYAETKDQLMWRLDRLLENTVVEKIFCQPKSVLDMHEVMREGKILLIDTSVKHLGEHGSSFLGKFILALVTIAAQQRKDTKRPVHFYIDEAGSYLTGNIATILERCREANVGLTIAHQQLEQLGELESTVMTNTAVKFIGRCNEGDARKLEGTLRVPHQILQHQPDLIFRFWAHGVFPHSVPIMARPGFVEAQPRLSDERLKERMTSQENLSASPPLAPVSTPPQEVDSEEPKEW